jgi:hypothetical protein
MPARIVTSAFDRSVVHAGFPMREGATASQPRGEIQGTERLSRGAAAVVQPAAVVFSARESQLGAKVAIAAALVTATGWPLRLVLDLADWLGAL